MLKRFIPLPPIDKPFWLHPPFFKSTQRRIELEERVADLERRLAHLEKWAGSSKPEAGQICPGGA